jgi:hypothetical protein
MRIGMCPPISAATAADRSPRQPQCCCAANQSPASAGRSSDRPASTAPASPAALGVCAGGVVSADDVGEVAGLTSGMLAPPPVPGAPAPASVSSRKITISVGPISSPFAQPRAGRRSSTSGPTCRKAEAYKEAM